MEDTQDKRKSVPDSNAKYVVENDCHSEASDAGSDEEESSAMVVLSEKASDDIYKVGFFLMSVQVTRKHIVKGIYYSIAAFLFLGN